MPFYCSLPYSVETGSLAEPGFNLAASTDHDPPTALYNAGPNSHIPFLTWVLGNPNPGPSASAASALAH